MNHFVTKRAVNLNMLKVRKQAYQISSKVRQTRFVVLHQPFTPFAWMRAVIIYYLLLTNAVNTQQIYSVTIIKVGASLLGRRY